MNAALLVSLAVAIVAGLTVWGLWSKSSGPVSISDETADPSPSFIPTSPQRSGSVQPISITFGSVEEIARQRCGAVERVFFVTLAGTSFPNEDGSSRVKAIKQCEPAEELKLVMNAVEAFPDAVIVAREDGSQLGYLDARLAKETKRRLEKYGQETRCFFQRANRRDGNGKIVGATVCMVLAA